MTDLFAPLTFAHGPALANRFMLAPLTNSQSHADGTLSDAEYHWLTLRAQGGFAATMTCAAHVQANGQGFPGQLGIFSDAHLPGLRRLAAGIKAAGSVALVQLHHAGIRAPEALIGCQPVGPSEDTETGSRALSTAEVEQLAEDFIAAAIRADRAGFDGVELHGAHSYILCAFLSPENNHRTDRYGGSPENRARLIHDIISGIRARCRADFILGIRLSPERFGLDTGEMLALAQALLNDPALDFVDMSLWDVAKEANDPAYKGQSLTALFAALPRGAVRLGVAGKMTTAAAARHAMTEGADFVLIGRAAVLHHDFPRLIQADTDFVSIALPVSREHLRAEGLSPVFVEYMNNWKGFVAA